MASADEFMRGLELLRPHFHDKYPFYAEHDVFYVHTTFTSEEETPAEIRAAFADGPWHWSSDGDCWAVFT